VEDVYYKRSKIKYILVPYREEHMKLIEKFEKNQYKIFGGQ
jgi:hypothetical protein